MGCSVRLEREKKISSVAQSIKRDDDFPSGIHSFLFRKSVIKRTAALRVKTKTREESHHPDKSFVHPWKRQIQNHWRHRLTSTDDHALTVENAHGRLLVSRGLKRRTDVEVVGMRSCQRLDCQRWEQHVCARRTPTQTVSVGYVCMQEVIAE